MGCKMVNIVICVGFILTLPAHFTTPIWPDEPSGIAVEMDRVRALERNASDLSTKLAGITQKLMDYKTEISAIKLNILSIVARKNPVIGFQAHIKKFPPSVKDQEVLKFDVVTQNRGGGYDRDTGVFTAPMEGLYMLWCNVLNYDREAFLSIYIYREGRPLTYAFAPPNVYEGVASVTTTTFLRKGNRVWFIKFKGSDTFLGAGWSSYGGSLIRAT